MREEHELEVGSAKIKCFTTASRLVAQEKAGKVEGGRGVLLLPDSDGDVAAEVADRLAFDADATVLYPDVDEEYAAAALLEAAAAFFAAQRVSATGAVGFGKSADAALLAAASFDAVVAWAPSSKELAAAATAPACVFTTSNAVELRDALDASKASSACTSRGRCDGPAGRGAAPARRGVAPALPHGRRRDDGAAGEEFVGGTSYLLTLLFVKIQRPWRASVTKRVFQSESKPPQDEVDVRGSSLQGRQRHAR